MSEEENRVYFSKKDITFYGDTEKEKKLNEQLFDASLLIAQKDDEIKELKNIIKEAREFGKLRKEMYERQENIIGQEVITSLLEILDKEDK